jgi:hypothetical protein
MASAGRILIMPKGNYDSSVTYEMLDMVYYNGSSWIAKKTVVGIEPSTDNKEQWQQMSDFEFLENRKQERVEESVNLAAKSSYALTLGFQESCLLCAYLVEPIYYSVIFACCGINEFSYSINKLSENKFNDLFSTEIGDEDGTNVNKISFYNQSDKDVTLVLVKLPFNNL